MSIQVLDLPFAEFESVLSADGRKKYIDEFGRADVRVVRLADNETIVQRVYSHDAIGEPLWRTVDNIWELIEVYNVAILEMANGRTFRTVGD